MAGMLIVYSDYICPYCYLGEHVLRRLRADGVECDYRPFELRPVPSPLIELRDARMLQGWQESVAPLAASLGVPITRPDFAPRTRKAHEALAYARTHGVASQMHELIFDSYFQRGADIGRIDVLVELGVEIGLDRTDMKIALDVDKYTEDVLEEERAAIQSGVVAVPTFAGVDGERVVGLNSYEVLREAAGLQARHG